MSNPTYSIFDPPTREEVFGYILSLFPTGPAWQSPDAAIPMEKSLLKQFAWGLSGPAHEFELACINTLNQFFCGRASDDLDLWLQDYANPAGCEPLDETTLCAKVSAFGGGKLTYYEELALKAGWLIDVTYVPPATVNIEVNVTNSPYVLEAFAVMDQGDVGVMQLGDPDTSTIECLLENAIPAHLAVTYTFI